MKVISGRWINMPEIGRIYPHKTTHQIGGSDQLDLLGLLPVLSLSESTLLAAAQVLGHFILLTAAATITLPPVAVGSLVTLYSTGANAVSVYPDPNDRIVLEGSAGGNGKKITSASAAGNFTTLVGDSAAGWTVVGWSGTWTMES
jgi:hypothetical protein